MNSAVRPLAKCALQPMGAGRECPSAASVPDRTNVVGVTRANTRGTMLAGMRAPATTGLSLAAGAAARSLARFSELEAAEDVVAGDPAAAQQPLRTRARWP